MSEDSFQVRMLPNRGAVVATDDNDELIFSFEGLDKRRCRVTGALYITYAGTLADKLRTRHCVLTTGHVDNKGRYSFNKRSRWATDNKEYYIESSVDKAEENYWDSPAYFNNNIGWASCLMTDQRKVRVRL